MDQNRTRSTATAYRRQRQIEDCLFENLLHTPYQSFSVADLCRQVGISRKAYYNYYRDKDSCLCSIINRVLRNSMLHTTTMVPDAATPLEAATVLLEYWREQKPFLDVIVRNNLMHFLLMQSMEYALKEDKTILDQLNTPDVKTDTDILSCYMTSQLTLILRWYFRNFDTPVEEMAKKYLRLTHVAMIQPWEKEASVSET